MQRQRASKKALLLISALKKLTILFLGALRTAEAINKVMAGPADGFGRVVRRELL